MKKKSTTLIIAIIVPISVMAFTLYIIKNSKSTNESFHQNNRVVRQWDFISGCALPVPALDNESVETVCVTENISSYSMENLIVLDTLEVDGIRKYIIRIFEAKNNRLVYEELVERDYKDFEVGILKDEEHNGYTFWILENSEARMVGFPEHNPIDDPHGEYWIRWKI